MSRYLPALLLLMLAAQAPLAPLAPGRPGARGKQQAPTPQGPMAATPPALFTGVLRKVDRKTIHLDVADTGPLQFRRSGKTKFFRGSQQIKPSDLKPGDNVSVEATRDLDGSLSAVTVLYVTERPKNAPKERPEDDIKVLGEINPGEPGKSVGNEPDEDKALARQPLKPGKSVAGEPDEPKTGEEKRPESRP
jgi:hypothetical protein